MRIGIMSFAHHHAEAYIANLSAIPGAELLGIADDNAERSQEISSRFNARRFPDYAALLKEAPDGVIICSENSRHRELVEMALAAGVKYILCEKPLATTLEDARAILAAVDAAGAPVDKAFPCIFVSPLLEAKAGSDEGQQGQKKDCE